MRCRFATARVRRAMDAPIYTRAPELLSRRMRAAKAETDTARERVRKRRQMPPATGQSNRRPTRMRPGTDEADGDRGRHGGAEADGDQGRGVDSAGEDVGRDGGVAADGDCGRHGEAEADGTSSTM